ncbi:MAG: hypothetical protein NC393_09465 [Clostridium sp.]|nr:hypothetical protein [Clostridium sp.]MCM1172340.1 hypothetical protein [Clostridium sp.]
MNKCKKITTLLCVLLIALNIAVCLSGCNQTPKLTLARVKQLAEKGENLSWDDFEQYQNREVGSGLLILRYDINKKYCLLIGGVGIQAPPMYIYLVYITDDNGFIPDGKSIDIRTENVDEFIKSNH